MTAGGAIVLFQNLTTFSFMRGATHLPFTTAIFVERDFAARRT